jgi:hypothetical protein
MADPLKRRLTAIKQFRRAMRRLKTSCLWSLDHNLVAPRADTTATAQSLEQAFDAIDKLSIRAVRATRAGDWPESDRLMEATTEAGRKLVTALQQAQGVIGDYGDNN